jgi:hypothetical protein
VDGAVKPQLAQARAEYDAWIDAQYEAAARQGDGFMRERRFAEAAAAYESALKLRSGGRAEPLHRYARKLQAGDAAVERKDWPAATRAYDEAVKTGMDGQRGYAATQLDRVQLRPFAIRVRSVLVRPIRPDGSPWSGAPGPGYQRVVGMLANAAMEGRGNQVVAGLDMYDALPHENRPNLVATMTLPDGRQFVTPAQRALRARYESYVVFATNSLDDRPVSIRVVHQDVQGVVEIGTVTVRMADLVGGGEVGIGDHSVVEMRLVAERSSLADGSVQGFGPLGGTQSASTAGTQPRPGQPPPRK